MSEIVDAYVAVQREKDTSQVPYRVQIPIRYTRKTTQSKFYATALKDVSCGFRGLKIGDNMTTWRVSWIRLTVRELNRKLENGEMDINNIISIQRDNSWDSCEYIIVYYKWQVALKESD